MRAAQIHEVGGLPAVGDAGVERLAADAVTVRCLITADGDVPESVDDPDLVAVVARSY